MSLKIGNESIRLGCQLVRYTRQEPPSHPGDLAASSLLTHPVHLRKPGSRLPIWHELQPRRKLLSSRSRRGIANAYRCEYGDIG